MRDYLLRWLPVFGAILCGTICLPGLLMGFNEAFGHISGNFNDRLFGNSQQNKTGLIPIMIFGIGTFSLTYGIIWPRILSETVGISGDIFQGIILGGIVGLIHIFFIHRIGEYIGGKLDELVNNWFMGAIAGAVSGGIAGVAGGLGLGIVGIATSKEPIPFKAIDGIIEQRRTLCQTINCRKIKNTQHQEPRCW